MNHIILQHAKLSSLKCLHDTSTSLIKVLGLPYGTITQRFARSQICENINDHPSSHTRFKDGVFDATIPGPSSIQPFGSVKSDASNIPLPTEDLPEDEEQSEDCLNLSIHIPPSAVDISDQTFTSTAKLPVIVFIHGGAYFLGSGNRPYYSPVEFLRHATSRNTPAIFVSINYRLGALGFWHAQTTSPDLVPPNNGLHDQILALQWVQQNIAGFGGDPGNVTALGQSAGGESLSILSNADVVKKEGLVRRVVMMSGTPVTMPAMTPGEHTENFKTQAGKLDIKTMNEDGSEYSIDDIAQSVINADVGKIRDLAWVGSPCTQTPLLPFDKPSMSMMRNGGPPAWHNKNSAGVEAQIISTTTFDGGISFNMMSRDPSRKHHAKAFTSIAKDVLGPEHGARLCSLYAISADLDDNNALQRICLFESNIGFFFAALSVASANLIPATCFHIFDLPNPFPGPLAQLGEYATHTFDITTLLGGYDQALLPDGYSTVVEQWRDEILGFVYDGKGVGKRFAEGGSAVVIGVEGVRDVQREEYMEGRREALIALADEVDGEEGWDILWVDVCRRFLMKGE
jgi:carboxylesterase type B